MVEGKKINAMNVLAIIPARGGSKGIPCKNITPLNGKPLLAYSIETALSSRHINRVVVSTDDEDIAAVALDYGAEVPALRPKPISGDTASIGDALKHTKDQLKKLDGYVADVEIILYPTQPFRDVALVDSLIGRCMQGFNPVITAKRVPIDQGGLFIMSEDGYRPAQVDHISKGEVLYTKPQGYLSVTSSSAFNEYLHILEDPVSWVDIDGPEDLGVARAILELGLWQEGARS